MNHPGIATILATGGNAMVKAAYSCGKPALGVGAGNVPCYINASCDQDETVNDVVFSKAFDNGMICASESAVFIDEAIYADMKNEIRAFPRLFRLPERRKAKLEKFMFGVERQQRRREWQTQCRRGWHVSELDRREERFLRSQRNLDHRGRTFEVSAPKNLLSRENSRPSLGFYKVKGPEEGFDLAEKMLEFGGLGHTRRDPLQRAGDGGCLWR
jgi:acetaldehyde dehydrogenase/alcohol dehydrogenase